MGNEKLSMDDADGLWECFRKNLPARKAAEVVGVQPNTAASHYRKHRKRIWRELRNELIANFYTCKSPLRGKYVPLFGIVFDPAEGRCRTVIYSDDMVRIAKVDVGRALLCLVVVFDEGDGSNTRTSPHSWNVSHSEKKHKPGELEAEELLNNIMEIMDSYHSVRREDIDIFLKECEWKFAHRRASPR